MSDYKSTKASSKELTTQVLSTYAQRVDTWNKNDRRDHWRYFKSKISSDYVFLSNLDMYGKRILNVGCNFPMDEIFYARRVGKWVAIDVNAKALERARKVVDEELSPKLAQRIQFSVADATSLPFCDNSFDVVVSFSTIEHIPSKEGRQKAVDEIARVTKARGTVVITVPNILNPIFYRYNRKYGQADYGYCHLFTPWEIKKVMREAGLRPIRFESDLRALDGLRYIRIFNQVFLRYFGVRMGYLAKK